MQTFKSDIYSSYFPNHMQSQTLELYYLLDIQQFFLRICQKTKYIYIYPFYIENITVLLEWLWINGLTLAQSLFNWHSFLELLRFVQDSQKQNFLSSSLAVNSDKRNETVKRPKQTQKIQSKLRQVPQKTYKMLPSVLQSAALTWVRRSSNIIDAQNFQHYVSHIITKNRDTPVPNSC